MRPTFRKLEVKDLGNLEKLVAENIESVEPGLRVIDSRILLGEAAIDLVALDSGHSLVLVALDFVADEGLLLRAMDAYSWCLEYPDTLRRLYPMVDVSPTHGPRILFIVERLTDAFVRRIKHLSFLQIDCLEFRHLEVNGASAVYFDLVERLRGGTPLRSVAEERAIATTPPRTPGRAPKRVEPEPPVVGARPAVPAPPVARPSRASTTREPAPFVPPDPPADIATAPSAVQERIVSLETRLAELLAEAAAAETPAQVTSVPQVDPEAPDASLDLDAEAAADAPSLRLESIGDAARQEEPVAPAAPARAVAHPDWAVLLQQLGVEIPSPTKGARTESTERASTPWTAEPPAAMPDEGSVEGAEVTAPAADETAPLLDETAPLVDETAPLLDETADETAPLMDETVARADEAVGPVDEAQVDETAREVEAPVEEAPSAPVEPAAPARTLPAWAKPSASKVAPPAGGRTYFFSQAAKGTAPADTPAATPGATPATSAPAKTPATLAYARPGAAPAVTPELAADRPELQALSFPKDGLSRQWLEFLNQLGGTK